MSKKYTYEEVKKFVNDLGYELIGEYRNSHEKIILKDVFGYYYSINLNNLKNNKIPSKFGIDNPYIIINLKLLLILNFNEFYLVEDNDYSGVKSKIILKDKFGYFYSVSVDSLQQNKYPLRFHPSNPFSIQNIKLWLNLNNKSFKLVSAQYKGNDKLLIFIDKNRYYYNCRFADMQRGKVPDRFNKSNVFTIDNIKLWCKLTNKDFELLSNKFLGSGDYLKWKCLKCNDEFDKIWENIKENRGCPACNKSKGEKECKRVFLSKGFIEITQEDYNKLLDIDKNLNIYIICQKTFEGLLGIRNGLLSYDFFIPKYNLLIEYQGEFHDGNGNYYMKKNLKKQKEHDRRKREYSENNNINLSEIWYWDYDNIENILDKILDKEEFAG